VLARHKVVHLLEGEQAFGARVSAAHEVSLQVVECYADNASRRLGVHLAARYFSSL
jgi:hypothetical protein